MMPDRAAAILLKGPHILLIHRIKQGVEYYVFPGGHVEPGETGADACIREVQEETGLDITASAPVFTLENGGRTEEYFWVQTTRSLQSAEDQYQPLQQAQTLHKLSRLRVNQWHE